MKTKIFPIFLIFTFSIIFFVFYKGLQNTNIYTPEIKSEIKIPNFDTKEFFSKDKINSDQIFIGSDYYLLNIWACLLYTSPSPRDMRRSRMPSSA